MKHRERTRSAGAHAAMPARTVSPGKKSRARKRYASGDVEAPIIDSDEDRADRTRELLMHLTRAIGLNPSDVEVHVTDEARDRTRARGANGLMADGRVYLNPESYDPGTPEGRQLLAHEVLHVAQTRLRGDGANEAPAHEAELEAADLAAEFAGGQLSRRPRMPLSADQIAADADADTAQQRERARTALHGQIDAMIALLQMHLPKRSAIARARLSRRRARLPTTAAALAVEQRSLQRTLNAIETVIALADTLESANESGDHTSEVAMAARHTTAALAGAIDALASPGEASALAQVQAAYRELLSAQTVRFIRLPGLIRAELPTDVPVDGNYFLNGYAQNGQIVISGLQRQWKAYREQVALVKRDIAGLGDLEAMERASLGTRLQFMATHGTRISSVGQRSQALALIHRAVSIGGVWMKRCVDSGLLQADHVTGLRGLRDEVVVKLIKQLAGNEYITTADLDRAHGVVTMSLTSMKEDIQKLDDLDQRMNLFVEIASTVVGMNAMVRVMSALTAVTWLYNGGRWALRGKAVLRFALGSLTFTGASAATRAALTGEIPGTEQLAKQAAMDFAMLGLLRFVHTGVGWATTALKAGPTVARAAQHSAAFVALWAAAAACEAYRMEPGADMREMLADTGKHTAATYIGIVIGYRLSRMPRLQVPTQANADRQLVLAQWNALAKRSARLGKRIEKWSKQAGKANRVAKLLEDALVVEAKQRGLFDKMQLTGALTPAEAKLLVRESVELGQNITNARNALRLGLRQTGAESAAYRGDPRNLEHHLRRLKSSGRISRIQRVGNNGAYRVSYPDGSQRVYLPTTEHAPPMSFGAEAVHNAAPKLPEAVRNRAFENLVRLPPAELARVTARLDGTASWFVQWASRPDCALAFDARVTPFAEMTHMMLDNPTVRARVEPVNPLDIQRWYELPFERVCGDRSLASFRGFLDDLIQYRGHLRHESLTASHKLVDQLSRTHTAGPLKNPTALVETRQFITSPNHVSKTPFYDHWAWLRHMGQNRKDCREVQIGKQTWVVKFASSGEPVWAWEFRRQGSPAHKSLNLRKHLAEMAGIVRRIETRGRPMSEQERIRLARCAKRLAFLRHIRGVDVADTLRLLDRASAQRPQRPDDWQASRDTQEALTELAAESTRNTVNVPARDHLIAQLHRQVPNLKLMQHAENGASVVLTLLMPGGGLTGIKTLNEGLVGYQMNSTQIIPLRKQLFRVVLEAKGLRIVEQTYKSTTLTANMPVEQVAETMRLAMVEIDGGMQLILRNALTEARTLAMGEARAAPPGSKTRTDAKQRIQAIDDTLKQLGRQFRFDMQFGMARIEPIAGSAVGFESVLAARMNATKAAAMARLATPDAAAGDPRGASFHAREFHQFCRRGERLRTSLEGKHLTVRGYRLPVLKDGALNSDVIRDVRKGKLTSEKLPGEGERATLATLKQYYAHINAFDVYKLFSGAGTAQVRHRAQGARELLARLQSTQPVGTDTANAVRDLLTVATGGGRASQAGEASESVFYNRSRTLNRRVLVNADIRDLGLDLLHGLGGAMRRVARLRKPTPDGIFQASNSATDAILAFKERGMGHLEAKYAELHTRALTSARTRGDHKLAEELSKESEPLLLLGGDEITLSLHPAMAPHVPELVQTLTNHARSRVAITRAVAARPTDRGRVEAHQQALKGAERGHELLKKFEAAERELGRLADELPRGMRKRAAVKRIAGLRLGELYTDLDAHGRTVLRRTSEPATALEVAEVRTQVSAVREYIAGP